jgi:hypothetical protein
MRRKTTCAVAAVVGLLTLSAIEAAAQAPVVTFQQNGSHVLISWNAIPGATAYDVLVSGSLNIGPISIPTTLLDVSPPAGTYVVQVRGIAPGVQGPYSAPVSIVVGAAGGGCAAPAAPDITVASGGGMAVIVTWPAVSGAAGYRVQVGRSPGATEFLTDLAASQTSFGGAVPFIGTFYIRVLAGSACGATSTSTEKSITVGAATPGPAPTPGGVGGSGPRAADPQPGVNYGGLEPGLLPMPDYAAGVALDLARRFPNEAAVGRPRECGTGANNNFLYRLLAELRKRDTRFGLNLKRGHIVPNNTSEDIIAYNPTNRPDDSETQIYLADIIGGECFRGVAKWDWLKLTRDDTWGVWFTENRSLCNNRYCARWSLQSYLQAGWPLNP